MSYASVPLQATSDVWGSHPDPDIIAQAYAYHRMLATSDLDGNHDEFDEEDDLISNPDDVESHSNWDSDDDVVPVFAINFHHRLLTSPGYRTPSEERLCINSRTRPGLWVTKPNLGLSGLDMGFLSQLAQLCVHANIKQCSRDQCRDQRAIMKKSALQCNWGAFSEWALVTMSCQAAMSNQEKLSPAHTHIATVVSCLWEIFRDCRRLHSPLGYTPFRPFLDGDSPRMAPIDLAQVSNLIYWMIKIQSQIGVGPTKIDRWNQHFLSNEFTLLEIERVVHYAEDLRICQTRLWKLVSVSDRKQSDLPDIISVLKFGGRTLGQGDHEYCTPSKCQWAHLNSISVTQLHKCVNRDCTQKEFPVELLKTALEMGNSTAWLCKGPRLGGSQDPYIAISHVWSDGTGVGLKDAGTVNSCLFDFFSDIAEALNCKAVWWDALSIPTESKARSKALNMMHSNYSNAKYTVVHDNALVNFPWSDDGIPCLALVLSTWFTRGWTALELSMSKTVKVMFGNPVNGQPPVFKDLDVEVLACNPGSASRAHWLATTLVKRLRQPVDDIGNLLAIMSSRSTSYIRDRTIIAALLVGVPDCDFLLGENLITIQILKHLGKIPYICLLHGKSTMRNIGPFSWCAGTLDDMPVDISADLGGNRSRDLEIDESGAVDGYWYCRTLDSSSVKRLKPYGSDLAAVVKINVALARWERCLLLHPSADRHDPLSLLVIPIMANKKDGILDCRYIGTVVEDEESESERPLMLLKVRLGAKEPPYAEGMHAEHAIGTMIGKITPAVNHSEEQGQPVDSPPEAPMWLQFAKPLNDHRSGKPLQAGLVINMDHNDLMKAIRTRRKKAALFLVKHGVGLRAMKVTEIFQQLGSGEEACASMKLLGDVYAETGQFREAISVHNFVEHQNSKIEHKVKNPLRPLLSKYALATTFVKIVREMGPNELRARFQVSAADYVDQAEEFLKQILKDCDRRAETRSEADLPVQERRNTLQDPSGLDLLDGVPPTREWPRSQPMPDIMMFSSDLDGQSSTMSQSGEHPTVATAEQARNAVRWHRLELNVIADLTLLLIGKEDFDGAAKTFQKALRTFGSLPDQDVEGFNLQSPERSRLGFEKQNQRDEQAANVYQRALRRFDNIFHGDHSLILLTSLHLGVNHLLRSSFSLAEKNLMRALNGFVSRLSPSSSDKQHSARSSENRTNEHIIICLTRYYLGVLFRSQNRLEQAKKQLEEVQKIALRFHRPEGQILELLAIHELGMIFVQKLKSEQKTEELVSGADDCFKKVSERTESWLTEDEVHVAQPRSLQAMRHLYFRSFSNLVLLHLHHGKLQVEVIQKLKKNLDQYRGDEGGAKTKKEDKKASDVAECEARRILGQAYMREEEFHSAEAELRIAWDGYIHLYGECHLETLDVCVMYADILIKLLERGEAQSEDPEKLLEWTVETYGQTVGSYHPGTLGACLKLGQVYLYRHKLEQAEKIFERAYHGFHNTGDPAHLMTARAARLLGDVYFERGTLGKAQGMYGKAYMTFSTMSIGEPKSANSRLANDRDVVSVTNIETLQALMDYAKVCALIRTTITRNHAINLYERAIKDFSALEDEPLAVIGKLVASMRLGALYGEIRHFRMGNDLIEDALKGFQGLLAQSRFRTMQDSIKESFLEAQLKLAQLKLNEHNREKDHTSNIKAVRLTIQNTHKELVATLGEIHMLTLEAYTALGELYVAGHGGSKLEHSPEQGEQILVEVLKDYGPHGKAKLTPGHPKRVRIMDSLISYYDQIGQEGRVHDLNLQLWEEIFEAYGFDQAVMMIDATSGPKHTVRSIDREGGLYKSSSRSTVTKLFNFNYRRAR